MASAFVLEECTFEDISVFISVLPQSMFEALFEFTLKEQLSVSEQFPAAVKAIVLPVPFISEVSIEFIDSKPVSGSSLEFPLVLVFVFVESPAAAMRHGVLPHSGVLQDIVFLDCPIVEDAFSVELPIEHFSLIPGPVGEGIDAMSALLIIYPISSIDISARIVINPVSMFLFAQQFSLVAISIFQKDRLPIAHPALYNPLQLNRLSFKGKEQRK